MAVWWDVQSTGGHGDAGFTGAGSGTPDRSRPTLTTPVPTRARPKYQASENVTGHIPGLDGIRAFAVVAVIAFHLWPQRVPGGFLGVDVFFVISGFLITTLLLRERSRNGKIDFPQFWLRRARRLLPALFSVVTVSVIAAALVNRDLLVGIGRQVLGAFTFSTNWLEIYAGTDYFNASSPTLFVTFWTLAVEEQFYLFWPLALVAILGAVHTPKPRMRVALAIGAVSAAMMAIRFEPGANPTRLYYGTDTHLAGMMIGAALALAYNGNVGVLGKRRWLVLRRWPGYVAMIGLAIMFWQVDSSSAFTYRGGFVLASLLASVAVACLPGPPTTFAALQQLQPLTWIGTRSYGLYLWHWPVILIVADLAPASAPGAEPTVAVVLASLLLTGLLTEASYRWIEMPVRHDGFRATFQRLWVRPAALVPVLAIVAVVVLITATAPDKSGAQLAVEQGEREIAAQNAAAAAKPVPTTDPPPAEAPAWPKGQPVPSGDLISGFGDSVMSGAAPAVYDRFPGVVLDAKPIRQWRDAPALVQAGLDAGTVRSAVVLNFGTNAGLESDESVDALLDVLEMLGPSRRIVLVNTVGVSPWVPSTNQKLVEISADHPNTIVMDWNSRVGAEPGLLHTDRTHPNMDGIVAYAEMLADAFERLGPA